VEKAGALPSVPGYQLERVLGHGAMGITYLGQRAGHATAYAIKVVKPSFPGSPEQIGEFLRSARKLRKLDHPNLVRVRDVIACPGGFAFISDFVPGLSADQVLQRDGPLPIKRAVRWANQMLKVLQYAHARKVMHRDIKPSNVLLVQAGGKEVVKLADFGVARVWQAAPFSGLSLTNAMINLASFIPPEVLFNFQEINPLADQYSLSAVLYYLLTGAAVLDMPKEERKRYSSLLRRSLVPLRERRSDIPPGLADVIHKGLARSPSLRFTDVGEFRQVMIRAVQVE
jgi:serine/threonine-protein kinase